MNKTCEEFDVINERYESKIEEIDDYFENYRKSIVTTVAYLIGVPEDKMAVADKFDTEVHEHIKNVEDALIIRCLCVLRTQFLRNFKAISDARRFEMRSLNTMREYLDTDAIKYLEQKGYEINIPNAQSPVVNIAYINQYIIDTFGKVEAMFPEWVEFKYIKSLFGMKGCYAGTNGQYIKNNYKQIAEASKEAGGRYQRHKNSYPYQMYISWPNEFGEKDGNILFNDKKFLKILYAAHGDNFCANRYVVDATADTKNDVYNFLEKALNAVVFVDCENVDPYAFAATVANLDDLVFRKIEKIVLFDDVNTSTAWDYIADEIGIPVDKVNIERVKDNKSFLDVKLTTEVTKEHCLNGVESIILVSSDSDFWGLINSLPAARFLVLNEYRKTSNAIIEKLDEFNIPHCYMSDFAQDKIQKFKSDVLYYGLLERINHFNETGEFFQMDVDALIRDVFYDADIEGAESQIKKEKEVFFNKYLKKGLLIKPIEVDGILKLQIEIAKVN